MVEIRLHGNMRLSAGAPFELEISLEVLRTFPAEIEIGCCLKLPDEDRLTHGSLLDKAGTLESISQLGQLLNGGGPAYIEDIDGWGFRLRFDAVPGYPDKVSLSGEWVWPLGEDWPELEVPELSHLPLVRGYFAFQRLVLPMSEVRRLTAFLRQFLDAHGDELPTSLESAGDEGTPEPG